MKGLFLFAVRKANVDVYRKFIEILGSTLKTIRKYYFYGKNPSDRIAQPGHRLDRNRGHALEASDQRGGYGEEIGLAF